MSSKKTTTALFLVVCVAGLSAMGGADFESGPISADMDIILEAEGFEVDLTTIASRTVRIHEPITQFGKGTRIDSASDGGSITISCLAGSPEQSGARKISVAVPRNGRITVHATNVRMLDREIQLGTLTARSVSIRECAMPTDFSIFADRVAIRDSRIETGGTVTAREIAIRDTAIGTTLLLNDSGDRFDAECRNAGGGEIRIVSKEAKRVAIELRHEAGERPSPIRIQASATDGIVLSRSDVPLDIINDSRLALYQKNADYEPTGTIAAMLRGETK